MGKRQDISKVVLLGSGPIVIGQACEFDYSGTQACKALMKEGYEVILINSNPATIMTDPELATRVYIEPLKLQFVKKVLEKERPDALIPTLGGQTALNLALELDKAGVLNELGIELLGAKVETIKAAEDREEFRALLDSIGAKYPQSEMVRTFEQGLAVADRIGFPLILRPNYTLGGGGGGVAFSLEEYKGKLATALHESPTSEVLVEESIMGWKEFELEVMRDRAGTFVVICSIENIDPCGVHTGDSITVAPQQTLTDRQYQAMRDEAKKIIEAVGVETGGANIQFAVDPKTGDRLVIEMNPRVSRSSALASKATGFPIAKIAALLAVGYELDEIRNDITGTTPSCYEPALDYVVTKIPRFAFEKFAGSKDVLTTQMKSVGEVMSIGRTLKESLHKAVHSLEDHAEGFPVVSYTEDQLTYPNSNRLYCLFQAFRDGMRVEEAHHLTQITPWFLEQIKEICDFEERLQEEELTDQLLLKAKRLGFSDAGIAKWTGRSIQDVRDLRWGKGITPCFFKVDTCAGEFASSTPYLYSTYWSCQEERRPRDNIVVVLGSGPNRIGQGIEFDYSCVRSVRQLQRAGCHVVMINSNPETVSTDYDTSNELYFEPLTEEHVLEVLRYLQPRGVVCQLGGQTPISLAPSIVAQGFNLLGSSLEAIDLAEDRGQFAKVCHELQFQIPESGMASGLDEAMEIAARVGYPLICRPSYVLGGRRMEIIEAEEELQSYFDRHGAYISKAMPCLMDQFLERALEVDVDLVRGKDWSLIGGVIEHIEAAGVHSGDSMGVLPPQRLKPDTSERIERLSLALADRLGVIGFLNLQLAIKDDQIFMLEANPRSSRSVPFIAKASAIPLVDLGVMAMLGWDKNRVKPEQYRWSEVDKVSVKGVVFPFKKFAEADTILGPEMKSTGESMGRGDDYSEALLKALFSSQMTFPIKGEVFLSLRNKDKAELAPVMRDLIEMGYDLSATAGTAQFIRQLGLPVTEVKKVQEGRPHCVDRIRSGQVAVVMNTTSGRQSIETSFGIRRSCIDYSVPCITESDAAKAFLLALKKHRTGNFEVASIPKSKLVES
ncbi:MAG: carbamoyl-phosphate synthase large subunit [Bdellovibrionaceae bacterium]|nr:carbamoyl-phosphate synthase large subunit [Bdellovibrionales bacterium]MCB9086101.1 carbamoyl-phosphate synthase large subunit [Pseudobdellovibrionaceae bacterium]